MRIGRVIWLALALAGCISSSRTVYTTEKTPPPDESAELQQLRAENEELRRQMEELQFWLNQYRETDVGLASEFLVLEVVNNFVIVSGELQDEVGLGDHIFIRRGTRYVGRARVEEYRERGVIARWDDTYPGIAAPPRVGDVVVIPGRQGS